MSFFKTSLGEIYQKCSGDDKFKTNLKFEYDEKNNFGNYVGEAALSHYHEAAYDAWMTGFAFAHILKIKEMDLIKFSNLDAVKLVKDKKQIVEMHKKSKEDQGALKNTQVNLHAQFSEMWINKMTLDLAGQGRFYDFDPVKFQQQQKHLEENPEFIKVIHLTFEAGKIENWSVEQVSDLFAEYGDFFLSKDTRNSCFIEFFYFD